MALLSNRRLILIEVEEDEVATQSNDLLSSQLNDALVGANYGVDALPDGADAVLVADLEIVPMSSDAVDRDLNYGHLGASEILLANTRVECKFSVELAGSGTAGVAPQYGGALRACGLRELRSAGVSVAYHPTSEFFDAATIYYIVDGVRHRITGARGTFELVANVGEIPTINFSFQGVYNTPEDVAIPAVNYANQATPLIFSEGNSSGFQFFSYAGCLNSVQFDSGNDIAYVDLIGSDPRIIITDRQSSGTVAVEAPSIEQKDYFGLAVADEAYGNLAFTHGTSAGNIFAFSSARVNLQSVGYGESDGIVELSMSYTTVPSSVGGDEFFFVFS